ncbi:MAG: amino acid-binding protein [Clostridium sp.]|nr:amino acid-binding protein [Clostridium sp.]
MLVKQLSVFIENREGRLEQVTEVLANYNINIVSVSLADTSEYGVLRMIVSDPDKGKVVLKEEGFSAMLTDVIAVRLPHEVGMLQKLLNVLCSADINIEYMYALATGKENASMIVKASNAEKALKALAESNMSVYSPSEAYSINS